MPSKALVVDANILVRAVLGKRVREAIETHAEEVLFFVPETAYAEAEEHLSALVVKHGGDPEKALVLLRSLGRLMEQIGSDVYGEFEWKRENGWRGGTRKIGPYWLVRSPFVVLSGRKTPISSAAA